MELSLIAPPDSPCSLPDEGQMKCYEAAFSLLPAQGKVVELGTFLGYSACVMGALSKGLSKQIVVEAIDTFHGTGEAGWSQFANSLSTGSTEAICRENIKRNELSNIVRVVNSDITQAASLYEDESVDFVFVDASHYYEPVRNDLWLWYPKVKKGGLMGGHDYFEKGDVKKAVDEFLKIINPQIENFQLFETSFLFTKKA